MKKLNKLFAILFAVLGVTTLKAQTDVTSQYLTNAGFDDNSSWITSNVSQKTIKAAKGWTATSSGDTWYYGGAVNYGSSRTINSVTPPAKNPEGNADGGALGISAGWGCTVTYKQEVTLPAGVYTLSYKAYNANTGATQANNYIGFTSSSVTVYGKTTNFTANTWVEESVTFALSSQTTGNISVGMGAISGGSGANAKLFVDGVKLSYKSFDEVSAENPADLTSHIVNNSFETGNLNGWTYKGSSDTGVKANSNNTYKTSGVDGNYLYNTWWQGTPLTQTVGNIPNGIYELKVLLASDQNAKLFLLANGEHSEVYTITTDNKTFHDVSYEFKVLNGQATIGVIGGNDAGEYVDGGHWWYKADNFRLIYKGADLSIEREAMDAALAKARAIDQATIPTVVAVSLNSAISTAENVENALNPIKAATNALLAVLATVDVVQAPYIETKALITSSNSMLTNSTASDADKATFQNAITNAEEDLNNATDKATIDAIAVTIMDAQKAYCLVASPTEGHPFDMTHLIVNPKFDQDKTGWTSDGGAQNKQITDNKPEPITGKYYENWNKDNFTGSIYQEISGLPNGTYKLKAAAFGNNAALFANDAQTVMANNDNTPAWYEVEVKVNKGTLKFGVQNNNNTGWMGIDNVTLQFISGFDLSEIIAEYESARNNAIAARDNADYSVITGLERTNLINAINQTITEETTEKYKEVISILDAATEAFIAAKSDYDTLASEITIAKGLGMTDENVNGIIKDKTGIVALQDLKVAEYNYIQGTYTESATLGSWTENFAEDLNGEGYKPDGEKYLNEWGNATRTAKQTVKLPAGDYAISSIGRGQVGTSGYLYYKIGDKTTQVDFIMKGNRGRGVDVDGVANFSDGGTYNCNGEGFGWEYRFITFHLDAETEVEIGVSATFANAWVSIYAPVLLTTEASVKALRLSEIATALGNVPTGKMDATVQAELDDAVAAAENVTSASTIDELNSVSTALTEAIAKAKTSVADYAAIKTYIDKADKIDASIAAGYKSQYGNGNITETATNVFQTLEVATYNYVTGEFKYPVALSGDWTTSGPVGELSDQHWSGEKRPYMEQSSAAWGWDAWSISYEQDLTLPAGEYVFKVAGRKAAGDGCTLELIVTKGDETLGTVNDFPEGDTGWGINKNGVTSFDANDEAGFANNNAGRAWQWRYVKFTLGEAATVNIAVKAEATTNHQWISFCDATVQMTEETYLEANKGGLDAPTAAANALVDTKPMGEAENTALKAALALPVTTGAELLAKIEALNIAVANANAWIPKYNEAKALLVAALERFEADYNDAQNGALNHMNKDRWATAISMAQAAAVAKDATDSYAGFETATNNLVAALDAATTSVNEYSALDAAIKTAKPLYEGGNWGDQAFQRPTSKKESFNTENAQAVYDEATADGEGVTSVTESLNEAVTNVNEIALNAPAEGARYNMVIDYEGWEHHGKAATYIANDRDDAGKYNIKYYAKPNANYAQAFTFTAVEGKANHYTLSMTDVDGNERYVCTGKVYGGNTSQIRTTTDATKALAVKVIATTTEGVWNLYNTEADNYIGGQDAGFYTVNSHTTFNLIEAQKANVTLKISSVGWATLILPFDAELPEDVVAYESNGVEDGAVQLVKAENLVANTPYLIKGTKGDYDFSGYGLATEDSYTKNLFVGTYVQKDAERGSYVLQNKNGVVAFYQVNPDPAEAPKVPTVGAYRSYMKYTPAEGQAASPMFRIGGSTGIDYTTLPNSNEVVIYDLMGRKVTTMEKGNMYIINGRKVIVK